MPLRGFGCAERGLSRISGNGPTTVRQPNDCKTAQRRRTISLVVGSSWLFNLGADIYAWFTAQAAWRTSCAQMARMIPDATGQCVVDLGCGPGVSTFELARLLPGANVIGIDI